MRFAVSSALVIAGLALTIGSPAVLTAGLFGPGPCHTCHNPCRTCNVNPCACAAPASAPQVTVQPQVQMVPQTVTVPQVSYRDVTHTQYRMQAETKTVPVTTYQTVTVDEGTWQKVWVPRIVQKQVPQVSYQQQVSYRQVPYQVTQRVPQVSYQTQTTMVPRVSHVPRSSCNVCGTGGLATAPTYTTPPIAMPQTVVPPPPQTAGQPVILGPELQPLTSMTSPSLRSATAATSGNLAPVPDPKYLDTPTAAATDQWTPVRTATAEPLTPVPAAEPPAPRTSSASGLFVPAPAAANVWRTRIR